MTVAAPASSVTVLMLMEVVLEVVVKDSLFRNAPRVLAVAVRRRRFEFALGLGRKARAGQAIASNESKDLVQRNTIVQERSL
jgi:hypothetical protein